jgi:D-sedoheptulose 7-phosphate isomerase
MSDNTLFFDYIERLNTVLDLVDLGQIIYLSNLIDEADRVWVIGNGGSCSNAEHFAEDLLKLKGKKATALSNSSLMTMSANDEGFENMFSYPLSKLAGENDLIICLTMGGKSKNILNVLNDNVPGKKFVITGFGGNSIKADKLVIFCSDMQILEDVCLAIMHMICKYK